jgi:hypothetical protein
MDHHQTMPIYCKCPTNALALLLVKKVKLSKTLPKNQELSRSKLQHPVLLVLKQEIFLLKEIQNQFRE